MTNNIKFVITKFLLQAQNATKSVFGRGLRWGSLRRSPIPLSRLGRGTPPPHSPSKASRTVLRPPRHKILASVRKMNPTAKFHANPSTELLVSK